MNVSVYISSEQIQMIGYTGKAAKRFVTHPLPEGAMYNGTIIDRAYMLESLKSINEDNPGFFKAEVNLIVDGSSILSRKISTPKLNPKQLLNLVRDDFSDTIDNPAQIVCGYRDLKASGENAIMGFAMTRDQLDSYISVFKEAGIKLSSVRIGTEAVINFVESRKELTESTIVLNIIDGMTMLSMIFSEGNNVFISRSRLIGDDNEENLGGILENLNGLVQFANSQSFGAISTSYYIGIDSDDLTHISERNQHQDVLLRILDVYDGPGGTPPPETHFCCLNMHMTGKCVDFLAAFKRLDTGAGKIGLNPKKFVMVVPAAVVAVLAVMTINLLSQVSTIDSEIERLRGLINSPSTQERQWEISLMEAEAVLLANVISQSEAKNEWENTRVPATSQILDDIIYNHDLELTVTSFDYNESGGTVRVTAVCDDSIVSTHYIDYLHNSGIALRASYSGFRSSGGQYQFSVDIILNLREAEKEEEVVDEVEGEIEGEAEDVEEDDENGTEEADEVE